MDRTTHRTPKPFRTSLPRRIALAALLAVAGLAMPLTAHAQLPQVPAQDAGISPFTSRIVRNAVEIRDTRTGAALLAPTHHRLLDGFDSGISAQTTLQNQAHGVDIIVTLTNTAGSRQRMGRLQLGIFNLGENIEYLWSRMNAEMKPANARQHIGQAWIYPSDLYSPVMVMRNAQQAVGVSINYPVLDYKHDVRVAIASPGSWAEQGEAGRGWFLALEFRNFGGENANTRMNHEGFMNPGETRTYVVSIRTTDRTNEWVRTLLPYRDYFRSVYGAVRYQRETSPVLGYCIADGSLQNETNPRGYATAYRPDLRGFGPFVRHVASRNWDEVMVWAPTGMYYQSRELNWPFHFASEFDTAPGLDTAFSTTDGFPWLVNQGTKVGLWWGRASSYISAWDAPSMVPFDPTNPVHHAAGLRELDAAVRAGATVIGLDTFTPEFVPMHDLLAWLDTMQTRHPHVRFITEPSQCDILHTRAPTWYDGWLDITGTTNDRDRLFPVQGPNVLSDFINPGSESWVGLSYRLPYQRSFGRPTNNQVIADARELAEWGFRPIISHDIPTPPSTQSAQSWEFTLPADIRESDPFIANLRAGRLAGQAAPLPPPAEAGTGAGSGIGSGTGSEPGAGTGSGTGTETGSGSGSGTTTGTPPGGSTGNQPGTPDGGGTQSGGSSNPSTGAQPPQSGAAGNGAGSNGGNSGGSSGSGAGNNVIIVVPPSNPTPPPPPGPPQSFNEQYNSTNGGSTPPPSGGSNAPDPTLGGSIGGSSSAFGNGPSVQAGDGPGTQAGNQAGNQPGDTPRRGMFGGGTSRRSVDASSRRSVGFRVMPQQPAPPPAPVSGPIASNGSGSVSPPNLNPGPINTPAPQPRVSTPTTTAVQAGGALRRATSASQSSQTTTVTRPGTSRRITPATTSVRGRVPFAPASSGQSNSGQTNAGQTTSGSGSSAGSSAGSSSGSGEQNSSNAQSSGSGTQTVTNTPATQAPQTQPANNP